MEKEALAAPATTAHLELEHVAVAYGAHLALSNVTLRVPRGARVAVVGPNGAGKSTLFKALAGLLPLQQGRVTIRGRLPGRRQTAIAYVPQRREIDWSFPVTVRDVVMMGRYGRLGWLRRPAAADHAAVARCLAEMGIAGLAGRPIGDLSGGQQQRVFLARALAQEPQILLMDEPFNGVDVATQEATLRLLDRLRGHDVTVLISTHDLALATAHADQVLLLNGRVIAYGPPWQVFVPEMLSAAFGQQLFVLPGGAMVVDHCCPPGGREGE
ncbi:MAG TPA: metal ABC transporter ATP-binding protein [Anaerolineae bacterium]|nr:metal ABC transporter ATP-binding protein [Anaerolineae bacterium]HPL28294.1 metal ABC transporter ATP-binding protein [Anaerolineae bacterium]